MASIPNPISFEAVVIVGTQVTSRIPRPGTPPQRSMGSALGTIEKRMEIHDLTRLGPKDDDPDLPNHLVAHFNPKEVSETIKVHWNEVLIPGLSHKRLQYSHTENIPIKFDLHFDSIQQIGSQLRGQEGPDGIAQAARFLKSLCYAKANAQTVQDGAPPRVLFYWPNFMSITCVMDTQDWKYTMFQSDGAVRRQTCSMLLKEIRDVRLSSSDVLRGGSKRNSPYPPISANENIIKVT